MKWVSIHHNVQHSPINMGEEAAVIPKQTAYNESVKTLTEPNIVTNQQNTTTLYETSTHY